MPSTVSGISLSKGFEVLKYMDSIIISNSNVKSVFGKIGRANTSTDPAPFSMIETTIELKDPNKIYEVIDDLSNKLKIKGFINTFGMPIRTRMDMLKTGIRTPIGIKVYGNEPFKTESLAIEIEKILKSMKIMEIINFAIGGNPITHSIEGMERYPIRMRILRDFREIDFLKKYAN